MATHSSILAWRISWEFRTDKPGRFQPIGRQSQTWRRTNTNHTHTHTHTVKSTDWGPYKKPKFISQSSGSKEIQDQGLGRFSVWWGPSSWFTACHFLLYPLRTKDKGDLSAVSFTKALIPSMRALSLWCNQLPQFSPPKAVT